MKSISTTIADPPIEVLKRWCKIVLHLRPERLTLINCEVENVTKLQEIRKSQRVDYRQKQIVSVCKRWPWALESLCPLQSCELRCIRGYFNEGYSTSCYRIANTRSCVIKLLVYGGSCWESVFESAGQTNASSGTNHVEFSLISASSLKILYRM